jgi:hypothetical protein
VSSDVPLPAGLGPLALIGAGVAATLALSVMQSLIGARAGSDHPVHVFLTRNIRDNGYRLFVRVPRLLNTCYCAALPLYLHWIMAHVRNAALYWSERLLNPIVNALHVALFVVLALLAARATGLPLLYVGLATCAFALTPQFYHALSARNFGLSSRGTGLLLLTAFFLTAYAVQTGQVPLPGWAVLAMLGWLIWGFNTFAQQALCIISVILMMTARQFVPAGGTLLGLALFVALHPRYSLGYLRHTLRFNAAYRRELAPIFILTARPSIWRDLLWDIWLKLRGDLTAAAHYAYGNSLLIVLVLNPLSVLAAGAVLAGALPRQGLLGYAGELALAGVIAMLLTSFRATRFLGEPERYVEAVTPWGVVSAGYLLWTHGPGTLFAAVSALYLLLDLAQLQASNLLLRHTATQALQLREVEQAIRQRLPGNVRFCCNNEHLTKMLMHHDWHYAYCIGVGQDYCGMKPDEAFSSFPLLRRAACERIIATYRVNACLLDRNVFDTVFDERPAGLRAVSVAYQSARLRLLILDWEQARV